jgi:hypothetical protein
VKVAPETPSMVALWAVSTSDVSSGMACSQICWEVNSATCRVGTETSVMRVPLTGTRQWLIAASLVAGVMLGFLLLSHVGHWLSTAPGAGH